MSTGAPLTRPGAIILDIEGTTTPIAFVYQTLFPYVRNRLRAYLDVHGHSPDVLAVVDRLRREHTADREAGAAVPAWIDTSAEARAESIVSYVEWLMDRDRKSTGLKELQGRIWEDGYRAGELVGQVFEDVAPALERWQRHGTGVGIFSSGSVLAQQLLFRYSSAGDLTRFLRWYFDTAVGAKTDADSYRRIATTLRLSPGAIQFVSDAVAELDAARSTGMRTALSLRAGNPPAPLAHGHPPIRRFDELGE